MNAKLIKLPSFFSESGTLTFAEAGNPLPFEPKRLYFLHGMPKGSVRGAHAHKALRQVIIAVAGSFSVTLDDGHGKSEFFLNNPERGLLIEPGLWRDIADFSPGAVCVVLASEKYDEQDYIRNYAEFRNWISEK